MLMFRPTNLIRSLMQLELLRLKHIKLMSERWSLYLNRLSQVSDRRDSLVFPQDHVKNIRKMPLHLLCSNGTTMSIIFVSTCIQPTLFRKKPMFRSRFRSCMHLRKVVSMFGDLLLILAAYKHLNSATFESKWKKLCSPSTWNFFLVLHIGNVEWKLWTRKHAIKHGHVSSRRW